MNIQHYIYTRGFEKDYGTFVEPDRVHEVLDIAFNKILGVIGDNVKGDLTIPKWILLKDKDVVLWGVCCENKLLTSDVYKDFKARPVRGFFAVMITGFTEKELRLPFDLIYFQKLYELEVEPYWGQKTKHKASTTGFVPGDYNYVSAKSNSYASLLNTDVFQCKSLGALPAEQVIAAALTLPRVSLIIDNDNIAQAIASDGTFCNCLSSKVPLGSRSVMQKCPKCGSYVSRFVEGGVCEDCRQIIGGGGNGNDLLKKIKELQSEVDKKNTQVQSLEAMIVSKDRQLKKFKMTAYIMAGLILCLVALTGYYHKEYDGGFGKKVQTSSDEHVESILPLPSQPVAPVLDTSINIGPDTTLISIDVKGPGKLEFKTEVDWVKLESYVGKVDIQVASLPDQGPRRCTCTASKGTALYRIEITQKR